MPKLKTKSSCKKRFRISKGGKLLFKHSGKNHGMTKRSQQQIRDKRKYGTISGGDRGFIIKNFLNYFKKLRKIL
ncbi:MAG: 50S ribosomal protein L35 [Rickettsiales bacterium]|jgi:large subunit ribosomal protein L35|nr:50S ribosomal protein L35 [Rickettsiales bacterium]